MAADVVKDPRVAMFQATMTQCGRGQLIQVIPATSCYQYGASFDDVLRSIVRIVYFVMRRMLANFMKYGEEASLQNGNIMGAVKAAIKPIIRTLIQATGQEIEHRMTQRRRPLPRLRSRQCTTWTQVKWERLLLTNRTGRAAKHQAVDAKIQISHLEYIKEVLNRLAL